MNSSVSTLVAATLLLMATPTASALQSPQVQTDAIPLTSVNWVDSVTFDKFDPDLGILLGVDVALTGHIEGQAAFENTSNIPATVTLDFVAAMVISRPGGASSFTSITPSSQFVNMVPAFDGIIDFSGPSGDTIPGISVTTTRTHSSPPPISDLALFTGPSGSPGTITLPVTTTGLATGSGAGNLVLQFTQQASATVELRYHYALDCNGNGISDADEISQGLAQDCNGNGIPDSCDLMQSSTDLNSDGIPDECTPDLRFLCDSDSVAAMTTNLVDSVTFDLFDPDLGLLENVVVTLTSTATGQAAVESLDNAPAAITLDFAALVNLQRPGGGSSLATVSPAQNFLFFATAHDGVLDFGGTSGTTFPGIIAVDSITHTSPPPATDLTLFTGTAGPAPAGTITLPIVAVGFSTATGPGGLIVQFTQQADALVEVCYVYRLDCNSNGIPDDVDLTTGSLDLDGDGIPDECAPGLSFCNGDGGNQSGCTACPCGNEAPFGTTGGCLNSAATAARLWAAGDTSVSLPSGSTTDLRFQLSGAPPSALCVLHSGDALAPTNPLNPCFGLGSGAQSIVFDGLRCAVMNTRRHGGRSADGSGDVGVTSSNPWGGEGAPPVGIAQQGAGFAPGQTRYFQIFLRDDPLMVCGRGLNTSQAIEITFTP